MKQRCYNSNTIRYKNYGGRGVTVCDEWKNDFTAFYNWAMANGYKNELTLDRIDVNGNYEPSNCRWATPKEQSNNKTNNVKIEISGVTHTMSEWAEISGVSMSTISARIKRYGWSAEKAIMTPAVKGRNQYNKGDRK